MKHALEAAAIDLQAGEWRVMSRARPSMPPDRRYTSIRLIRDLAELKICRSRTCVVYLVHLGQADGAHLLQPGTRGSLPLRHNNACRECSKELYNRGRLNIQKLRSEVDLDFNLR